MREESKRERRKKVKKEVMTNETEEVKVKKDRKE
jgi:hypothetical protein